MQWTQMQCKYENDENMFKPNKCKMKCLLWNLISNLFIFFLFPKCFSHNEKTSFAKWMLNGVENRYSLFQIVVFGTLFFSIKLNDKINWNLSLGAGTKWIFTTSLSHFIRHWRFRLFYSEPKKSTRIFSFG